VEKSRSGYTLLTWLANPPGRHVPAGVLPAIIRKSSKIHELELDKTLVA